MCVCAMVYYRNGGVRYLIEACGYMPWYGYTRNGGRCMYCVTRRLGCYCIIVWRMLPVVMWLKGGVVVKREVSLIFLKRLVVSICRCRHAFCCMAGRCLALSNIAFHAPLDKWMSCWSLRGLIRVLPQPNNYWRHVACTSRSLLKLKNNPLRYTHKCFRSFSSQCKSYGVLCHVLISLC
jgi:hypothetical protein